MLYHLFQLQTLHIHPANVLVLIDHHYLFKIAEIKNNNETYADIQDVTWPPA